MENIANKTVIITGASSGLGAEIARHLVQNGAHVILGARRLDRLQQLADELGISHDYCVQTDVAASCSAVNSPLYFCNYL